MLKSQFYPVLWLGLINIARAFYKTTDKLFIPYFGYSDSDLAAYNNGYKIFESSLIVPGVAIPMLVSFVKKRYDKKILTSLSERMLVKKIGFNLAFFLEWSVVTIFLGFVLMLGVLIFGPILLGLIDPDNLYPEAYSLLPVLAVASFFQTLVFMTTQFIIFNKKGERYIFYTTTLVMICSLLLYLVLIPAYGIYGFDYQFLFIKNR